MLELNTDNKITIYVEVMKANLLIPLFDAVNSTIVFQAVLNELDLIKLKIPYKEELKGIVEGNMEMYNIRIDERLSCKVCIFFKHLTMDVFQFQDPLNVHISFILNM